MAVEDRAARRAAAAPAAADADHVAPAAAAARPGSMAERRTSRPRTVLVVASFGVLMAFIDATIVNVAFPEIQRSFPDAGFGTLSWVLNAYNIFFAAFLVAAGRMADLLGRKRVFELGIALFTSMSVLCAIAPTVETLIAARILQAVGAAIVVPASLALVLEAYPGATRRHGVAAWSAVSALAAGLGPALGGLLIEISDWRLVFLVNLPIGVAAWLLSRRHLVESRAAGRRRVPDLAGALVLAAAIGALTLGLVEGEAWGWASPAVLACFAASAVAAVLFVRRCRWHRAPIVDLALVRIRSVAVSNSIAVAAAAGYYAVILCNVLFLTRVWDYSPLEAGLALTPGPIAAVVIAGLVGRFGAREDVRPVLVCGALVWMTGAIVLASRMGAQPDFFGDWLPGALLLGVGAGLALPSGSTAAVAAAKDEYATATALHSVARQLGAVLGVALLVAILGTPAPQDALAAFDRGWTFAAVCFGLAAVGGLTLGRLPATTDAVAEDVVRLPAPEPQRAGVPAPADEEDEPATGSDLLGDIPLFAQVAPEIRAALEARMEVVAIAAGAHLFEQGDRADAMYVVRTGRLEVVVAAPDAVPVVVAELRSGDAVGELGLISGARRNATVRARRDCELLRLMAEDFSALIDASPAFGRAMTQMLAGRLEQARPAEESRRRPASTIAVVPLTAWAPAAGLAERLLRELARTGTVARLDAWQMEDLAENGNGDLARARELERLEQTHDRVILVSPLPLPGDPWADFALRQADRILAVVDDAHPPRWLAARPELRGCDLVCAGADGEAAAWLEPLAPRRTHRLAPDSRDAGASAIARRISGRSVGLVLSGGGARGFAHIGAIAELVEAGVTIDRVGGCSIGALIGAGVALGWGPKEIDARVYEEFLRRNPLGDYAVPRHALYRGERLRGAIMRHFDRRIEDMPLPFYCVSADLVGGDLVVHRTGSLARSICASLSIPGVLPPVAMGERLLVDGGILDNLPVASMAADGEGPIIAVDVTLRAEADAAVRAAKASGRRRRGEAPGDWDRETPLPSMGESLLRLVLLGSADTQAAARRHADLLITPGDEGVGMLEWHMLDRMADAGRRAAREALEHAPSRLWTP